MARSITARLEALERGPVTGVRADIMELRYDSCYKAVVEQNAELARLRAAAERVERIEAAVVAYRTLWSDEDATEGDRMMARFRMWDALKEAP